MLIPLVSRQFSEESGNLVREVLDSGWVAMGERTEEIETRLCEISGCKHAVATNSCTSSLYIAFRSSLSPGSRVIVSPITFVSSIHAIVMADLIPVFVDIDPQTGNIHPDALKIDRIPDVDAILLTHYAGIPCSESLIRDAKDAGLVLIDDSAHALGARRRDGRPLSLDADICCYSFNSTKIFSCGEGGAILTNHDMVAKKSRLLRNYGMTRTSSQKRIEGPSFEIEEVSLNFKFNDISAAVLLPQLDAAYMESVLVKRKRMARAYSDLLQGTDLGFYREYDGDQPSWLFFPTLLPPALTSRRTEIIRRLRSRGVESSILFPDVAEIAEGLGIEYLGVGHPIATDMGRRVLTLPCHESLTKEDVQYVVEQLMDVIGTIPETS